MNFNNLNKNYRKFVGSFEGRRALEVQMMMGRYVKKILPCLQFSWRF